MNTQPLVFERTYDAPISKVWKAITDRDEMEKWYFKLQEFRAEPGFVFQFRGGPAPDRQYQHICEVTEAKAPNKLTYSWRYDGYPGVSHVTFELFEEGNKTKLRLTHAGLENFQQDNPDFARKNFNEGWTHFVHTALRTYLEGKPAA
jgi:uncharacterized protein YndB with AHSA1/START domain